MSIVKHALAAAKRGWKVIPLNGKIPITGHGSKDGTTDKETIRAWFYDNPEANYGICTGPESCLYVIDIDGPEGQDSLEKLPALPETFTVQTGRGTHYYFTTDKPLKNTANKLGAKIDTRGKGGYVVGPGSIHPDTKEVYKVTSVGDAVPLPEWVLGYVVDKPKPKKPPQKIEINGLEKYVQVALDGMYKDIANAPSGARNDTLNTKSFRAGLMVNTQLITREQAEMVLESAGRDAGLNDREITKTVKSGLDNGIKSGETIDLKEPLPQSYTPPPQEKLPTKEKMQKQQLADLVALGEIGDAQIFVQETQGELLFNHTAGKWMEYIDGRWVKDETSSVRRRVHDVLYPIYKEMAMEAYAQKMSALGTEDHAEIKKWNQKHKEMERRLQSLGNLTKMENILKLAGGLSGVVNEKMDADPMLLNLKNGTYNFTTGQIQPHRYKDYISKRANIQYNPNSHCSNWLLFLSRIFDRDQDTIEYVQKIMGLCLTGSTDYQHLFFCYGSGANGKSTLFNVLNMILGDFYVSVPSDVLLTKQKNSSDEYHIARLKGARLAVSSEIPAGRRLQESLVKDLTSNDLLIARNPYEKPFNFEPTHKLWMFGNHKPFIPGHDHGIWRRIRLIPFEVQIPESERRPNAEMMAEFEAEKSGILNWMIEGFHKLKAEGLTLPPKVKAATDEYQEDSDSFRLFGNCKLTYLITLKLPLVTLWEAYEQWCIDEGEYNPFKNKRQFARGLRERGLEVKKLTNNATYVVGVGWSASE